jgi:uncharacterized protein (DUF362 family)
MTRRELLALASAATLVRAKDAPAPPVAIARCASYDEDLSSILRTMFDQTGIDRLVANKTVTIKLNLTGSPALRFQGKPLGSTHYTHPKTIGAMIAQLDRAGAKRIRLVESCAATAGPLEEYMLDSGWNVRSLRSAATRAKVEFENTNALGTSKKYVRVKPAGKPYIFPAYELNAAYVDTDVFMSMAKLKNHATCGVTLAMKNCFGNTPASIYGDDAGFDEPNESPTKGRLAVCHFGKRAPSKIAPPEIDPQSSREPEYRMPRITAELVSARPIDIAFIDGVETVSGGEGPWIKGLRYIRPGVLLLGTNGVTTDAVATAVMGYDPLAPKGTKPFQNCDNTFKLAEALGVGTPDLKRIEVRGLTIQQARFPFES